MRLSNAGTREARPPLLPSGTSTFFKNRAIELAGALLAVLAFAVFLSCLTYNPQDPSWNDAVGSAESGLTTAVEPPVSNPPVSNPLGLFGSHTADIMMQSLGLAALLAPLVLFAWGWRLLRERQLPSRWWWRLAAFPTGLILLAMSFEAIPKPDSWPLDNRLGGFVGDLALTDLGLFLGTPFWMLALAAFILGLPALLFSLGLTRPEWQMLRGGVAWVFGGASRGIRQAMQRQSRGEPGEARAARREASRQRVEPKLDEDDMAPAYTSPAAYEPEEDFEEEEAEAALVATKPRKAKPSRRAKAAAQGRLDLGATGVYETPPLNLLDLPKGGGKSQGMNRDALEKNARILETVLEDFGVRGEIVKVRPGPVVTRYDLEPAPGTKTSRVVGLADDIARSMSAVSVRVAVVPGDSVIGIELPNAKRDTVYLRELLAAEDYEKNGGKLPLVLGKDIGGVPNLVDLARMPHVLVAGTTGSGKSVAINAMILSLLYRLGPEACKFIMVDPKMLELSVYDGIPHLLAPVVTEPKKAVVAMKWAVREMEERYRAMSRMGVRNVEGYNARVQEAQRKGEVLTRKVQTGFDPETGQPIFEEQPFDLDPLPLIVVIVDELADLMLVAGKDVEAAIQRLAQMARAAGIHLIVATQRPSVDVITGTIKANFPTRISFHVTSKIDSRTILGEQGAEQLLGQGDMLYMAQGGRITRVHGPLVTDQEVEDVVAFLKRQGEPSYIEAITEDAEAEFDGGGGGFGESSGDDLYDQAVALVLQHRKASTSFVQRHLQIGYNRAARIIERMESEGLISAANHVGKREVIPPGGGDV
ncbi:DNA translocase FtsK 4TM domain-containing protein [Pelagibius sp.]|uniref:FtsK/SpoIIIE family DNA translocase n=1 Tax=Pelagibius sp. TaxID=1931238 RepID=UPI003BAE5290